jgi:hypothetical protein
MQQNKGIQNISIIGNDPEKNANDIFHTLSKMKILRIGRFFNGVGLMFPMSFYFWCSCHFTI